MQRSRGFSLLEMLVVLLIVGLFSALGVAYLDAGQAPMRQALAQLASDKIKEKNVRNRIGNKTKR